MNSLFFHNSIKRRHMNNKITRLKDAEGNWTSSKEELNVIMLSYFQNLFNSFKEDLSMVIGYMDKLVTTQQMKF